MIKIIAGSLKGKSIPVPPNAPRGKGQAATLRPTSNKVREAVFDILGSRLCIEGMNFLDLFAGTGAVGLEALSRGAARVEFIDSDRKVVAAIQQAIAEYGLTGRAVVHQDSVPRSETFDAVFADPPYKLVEPDFTLAVKSLADGGYLVYESSLREPRAIDGVQWVKSYRYGKTNLHLYEKLPESLCQFETSIESKE